MKLIKAAGGYANLIESRKSPGNSDVMYSLQVARGLMELKRSVYWKLNCKIRLVHPLKPEQRNFLRGHSGQIGAGPVMVGVLFTKGDSSRDHAAFWSFKDYLMAETVSMQLALDLSAWHGPWPPGGPGSAHGKLIEVLAGG